MLFISRHTPTEQQIALAKAEGFDLLHEGDVDAFDVDAVTQIVNRALTRQIYAFAVVHPALALNLVAELRHQDEPAHLGVFENASRPPEGGAPSFVPVCLHIWDLYMDAGLCSIIHRRTGP